MRGGGLHGLDKHFGVKPARRETRFEIGARRRKQSDDDQFNGERIVAPKAFERASQVVREVRACVLRRRVWRFEVGEPPGVVAVQHAPEERRVEEALADGFGKALGSRRRRVPLAPPEHGRNKECGGGDGELLILLDRVNRRRPGEELVDLWREGGAEDLLHCVEDIADVFGLDPRDAFRALPLDSGAQFGRRRFYFFHDVNNRYGKCYSRSN